MIRLSCIKWAIQELLSYFFALMKVFIVTIDTILSSSDIDEVEVDTKKNSSLAWGNTHDDGWID